MSDFFHHLATKARKKLGLPHSLRELDPELIEKDLVFTAPPFTPELVEGIQLISPQFNFRADERSRRFWELNQNGLCWGEYEAIGPFLEQLGKPRRVLDIGPGLGRSTIFLKKHCRWQDVAFDIYEGDGESTKYTRGGPRFDDSFCGNLGLLEQVLEHNEIEAYEIFDASALDASLARLPGPYDLIYSFFAVGFHWSLEHFLDEILGLMSENALGFFTLHDHVQDLGFLKGRPHRVVTFRSSWPRGRNWRLLVLGSQSQAEMLAREV